MLCEKMETLVLSPQQHSLFLPDNGSSSETSGSDVTSSDLSVCRSALNRLSQGSGRLFGPATAVLWTIEVRHPTPGRLDLEPWVIWTIEIRHTYCMSFGPAASKLSDTGFGGL
jgi:hypothetical protein